MPVVPWARYVREGHDMLVCFAFLCGTPSIACSVVVLVPVGERSGVNGSLNGGSNDTQKKVGVVDGESRGGVFG